MKKDYIIWGATGQALVVEEALHGSVFQPIAIFDNSNLVKSPIPGIPIFYKKEGFEKWVEKQSGKAKIYFVVAIGGEKGKDRSEISSYLQSHHLFELNVIHKTAYIAYNAVLGNGVQIMAHATICAKTKIMNNVIVNTNAVIEHECILHDGVHIGPGAALAGCVEIGDNSFIGVNATILPRITIGNNVIIGAGSVVTKNVPDNTVIIGNPGKQLIKK